MDKVGGIGHDLARVPGIDTGRYLPGAVYIPDAGHVSDPQLAAHNLAMAAIHHGVRFLLNRSVVKARRTGERVSGVAPDHGTVIESAIVVNAAGPWSGAINTLAGVGADFTTGTRPLRQETHRVTAPAGYLQTAFMTSRTTGHRSTTVPSCPPSIWRSVPAATSSRTRR